MERMRGQDGTNRREDLIIAQQRKSEWIKGLRNSDSFALLPTLTRLTLNMRQFSLAFQIPSSVLEKLAKRDYCLVAVAHGGSWSMRAVRLNEITGTKDVSQKRQLYLDLLGFVASSHPDEISSHLRLEADNIFRSLPKGMREQLKSQGRDPDCVFSTPQEYT